MKINLKKLCAISKFAASKEATRFYLCGLFVQIEEENVRATATDGHRLITAISEKDGTHEPCEFIIPADFLAAFRFKARGDTSCDLTFEGGMITIDFMGRSYTARAIDGTFPDYKRVIPAAGYDLVPAKFSGASLKDMEDFSKMVYGGTATVVPNGSSPAFVKFSKGKEPINRVLGVLMPMRPLAGEMNSDSVEWVR